MNNDRSRDYTIPNNPPMVNSQPPVVGQQPGQMMGPSTHQYNGNQYGPSAEQQPGVQPQQSPGWGSGGPGAPYSMPMHNPGYMPSGTMPPQQHGMMPSPSGLHQTPPPPYRPDHRQ